MLQQRMQMVKERFKEICSLATQKFGVRMDDVELRFDLKGRSAGIAGHKAGRFYVRFNTTMMTDGGWDHLYNDTIPHELAHIVCYKNPAFGRKHDLGWKRVCKTLGGNGQRCHNEDVINAKGNTYEYQDTLGKTHRVGQAIHRRIQAGSSYSYRGGGKVDKYCAYRLIGVSGQRVEGSWSTPAARPTAMDAVKGMINGLGVAVFRPAMPPATVPLTMAFAEAPVQRPTQPVARVAQQGGGTNADKVRARITQAKRAGEEQDVVVAWAVMNLGMKTALARTYVKNNWAKA